MSANGVSVLLSSGFIKTDHSPSFTDAQLRGAALVGVA